MAIPLNFSINVNLSPQAQQLLNLLQNLPAGGPQAPANPPAGGGGGGSQQATARNNGIFKPLLFLGTIDKTLSLMFRESRIASTYLSAMGKVFGAAIDILLIPFIPVFNLIMIGMTKLLDWLINSGYLERMTEIMGRSLEMLAGILDWGSKVWQALKDFDLPELASLIIEGIGNAINASVKDPAAALMLLAGSAVAIAAIAKIVGPILKTLGIAGAGGGGGGILGGGGGKPTSKAGIAGTAAMRGLIAYTAASAVTDALGWSGFKANLAKNTAGGAAVGSAIPGVGTIAGAIIGAGGTVGWHVGKGLRDTKFGDWAAGGKDKTVGGRILDALFGTSFNKDKSPYLGQNFGSYSSLTDPALAYGPSLNQLTGNTNSGNTIIINQSVSTSSTNETHALINETVAKIQSITGYMISSKTATTGLPMNNLPQQKVSPQVNWGLR